MYGIFTGSFPQGFIFPKITSTAAIIFALYADPLAGSISSPSYKYDKTTASAAVNLPASYGRSLPDSDPHVQSIPCRPQKRTSEGP